MTRRVRLASRSTPRGLIGTFDADNRSRGRSRGSSMAAAFSLVAFVLLTIAGPVSAGERVRRVVVSGTALRQSRDDAARSEAVGAAMHNAVSQVAQQISSPASFQANRPKFEAQILSQSNSYVGNYTILDESTNEEGLLELKLELEIDETNLANDLRAIGVLLGAKRYPRMMILFDERGGEQALAEHPAETAALQEFLARGFTAVDQGAVAQLRATESARAAIRGDDRAAKEIGLSQGAEVMVLGTANYQKADLGDLGGLVSCRAEIQSRALVTATGEIIAVESSSAGGAQITEGSAGSVALKKAAADLSEKLIERILRRWTSDVVQAAQIRLLLSNVPDYAYLLRLKSQLETNVPMIQEIVVRDFTGSAAELGVKLEGDSFSLAERLVQEDMAGLGLSVVGVTSDRLELRCGS